MYQFHRISGIHFFSEKVDIDIHHVRTCIKINTPNFIRQFRTADNPVFIDHQVFKKGKFFGTQIYELPCPDNSFCISVQFQVGNSQEFL